MELLERFLTYLIDLVPTAIAVISVVAVLFLVKFVLERRFAGTPDHKFRLQLVLLFLSLIGLVVITISLPVSETTTGQLLSLLGILLSAAIALSSTTFVGNMMAGLMQRVVRNFRPGDFIRVGDYFGRVSEQGLFHVEIQTEDRDLTTMPNLYLVTNPVKVIRSSGTLVTAEVSLGYDVPRQAVEAALIDAVTAAGLEEPFVHVIQLNDFSVTYRAAGLLTEVKRLLSRRSGLRAAMLDCLHRAGIEIVSPTFMNQRVFDPRRQFVPPVAKTEVSGAHPAAGPEDIVFDKAEEAASLEKLLERRDSLKKELERLGKQADESKDEALKTEIGMAVESAQARLKRLDNYIAVRREAEE